MSHTYDHPRPALTADIVVVRLAGAALEVLLVRRASEPFAGRWALPGGFVEMDETVEHAAARELEEETGLSELEVEQLHTFSDPGRDPRARVVTVAHLVLVRGGDAEPRAGDDASETAFVPISEAKGLAFDHDRIVEKGLERLRFKARYEAFGLELLPAKFTLSELQRLYEIVLDRPLDKRNFRKKMLSRGLLVPLDEFQKGVAHRAARYYRFDRRRYKAFGRKSSELES